MEPRMIIVLEFESDNIENENKAWEREVKFLSSW